MTTAEHIFMYIGFILWFIAGYSCGKRQQRISFLKKKLKFWQQVEGRTNDIEEDEKYFYRNSVPNEWVDKLDNESGRPHDK